MAGGEEPRGDLRGLRAMFWVTLAGGAAFLALAAADPAAAAALGCGGATFFSVNLAEMALSARALTAARAADYAPVLELQLVYKLTWCALASWQWHRGAPWTPERTLGLATMSAYFFGDALPSTSLAAAGPGPRRGTVRRGGSPAPCSRSARGAPPRRRGEPRGGGRGQRTRGESAGLPARPDLFMV